MAGTNRNRKLPLNEAWKHYWSTIFPGGTEWRDDLEREIRKRLYAPVDGHSFMEADSHELEHPSWAEQLSIAFEDDLVVVRVGRSDIGALPLLAYGNMELLSNWANGNPLKRVSSLDSLTARDLNECRNLANAAVRDCGNRLHGKLLRAIRATEQPKFEVSCLPDGDVFANARKLPTFALSKISRLNIIESELCDPLGKPIYTFVHIKLKRPSASRSGRHGSFEKEDLVLIAEMKALIDQETAKSVREAANLVVRKAKRQKGSKDESVVRRLQDGFASKYPGYLSSKINCS